MEARPGEDFRNILLILLAPIGDTLFATPAIRALRRAYPAARLTAVVWRRNRAVLENNPEVDRLLTFRPAVGLFRELRRRRFDLAVAFAPYQDYFGLLAGIPRRLALPAPWLFWLLPHRNRRWQRLHARDHYLEVLRPLGIEAEDRRLVLKISGRQEAFAERFLADHGHRPGELLLGIHPGGSGFKGAKRWSPEGFAWVARQLAQADGEAPGLAGASLGTADLAWNAPYTASGARKVGEAIRLADASAGAADLASAAPRAASGARNVRLVFFGGPGDGELARAVVAAGVPDGFVDTCGRVSLSEAIGLLSRLDLFVGNDSGPLHLAAALGVPSVGIYGPTNVLNFHPIGPSVRAVYGAAPCPANYGFIGTRPAWSRRTCQGECLASIDPRHVLAAAQDLLAGAPELVTTP